MYEYGKCGPVHDIRGAVPFLFKPERRKQREGSYLSYLWKDPDLPSL